MFVSVLGIDPGLTRCGYGIVRSKSDRTYEFISTGIFTTSPQAKISDRLAEIHSDITELIAETKPEFISIERVVFQKNATTAMSVAQVSGLVHSVAASNQIPVTEYSPTEVKNAITGDGKADKQAIAKMVTKLLGLTKTPNPVDAADALAIALTHAFSLSYQDSKSNGDTSDNSTYNGSNLHNAIADAITRQAKGISNPLRQKEKLERKSIDLVEMPPRRRRGLSR